jgi:hypothetical protein
MLMPNFEELDPVDQDQAEEARRDLMARAFELQLIKILDEPFQNSKGETVTLRLDAGHYVLRNEAGTALYSHPCTVFLES